MRYYCGRFNMYNVIPRVYDNESRIELDLMNKRIELDS